MEFVLIAYGLDQNDGLNDCDLRVCRSNEWLYSDRPINYMAMVLCMFFTFVYLLGRLGKRLVCRSPQFRSDLDSSLCGRW